jgi:hypothetical protein
MRTKELTMVEGPGGLTTVSGKCVFTGEEHSVTLPTDGVQKWLNGELIQRARPNASAEDREFLISGISPNGWSKMFG